MLSVQNMEGKSQTEQEKDIRELLRRAERYPGRNSNQVRPSATLLAALGHSCIVARRTAQGCAEATD